MRYIKKYEAVTLGNFDEQWDQVLGNLILRNDIETIKRDWLNTLFFDINSVNRFGTTPLKIATVNRNIEIMTLFLNHGADPNIPTGGNSVDLFNKKGGRTPLMSLMATYNGNPELTIECMRLLISRGADVNIRDKNTGKTAILFAAECCDSVAVMKELIKNGADLFALDDQEHDALYYVEQRVNSKIPKGHRMLKWMRQNYFTEFAKARLAKANSKRFDL